jgi:AcrR family transcriptional regulator
MRNTKDRILKTSLVLFNEKGLANVSLRFIAEEMQISVGNVQYHFKKREEIIYALYFQLVEQMDNMMSQHNEKQSDSLLKVFITISKTISETFFLYRFFLLDFNMIIREHSTIKKHYVKLTLFREQQFIDFIKRLNKANLIREEILPNEYEKLFIRFQIISDFWISRANIQSDKMSEKIIQEYLEVINQTIFPYLTKKGIVEYLKITKV